MSLPIYINVVSGLFLEIHKLLDHYVNNGYHALMNALKYPLGIVITLYIVLLGYSISQGWVRLSMSQFVKSALKIAIIYTFAMNWDFFSANVIQFIQGGANQLGGVIFHASNPSVSYYGHGGIEAALQKILVQFTKIGFWFWKRGSWHSVTPYLEGIIIWGSGISLLLVAMFQLILANIMLALLFVSAPLFIGFAIFKPTQGLFDRWLGNVVSFSLLILFVSIVLGFVLSITNWAISGINKNNLMTLNVVTFVPIVLVVFIGIGLVKRVASLAHEIGMATSTLAFSTNLANTIGEYIGGEFSQWGSVSRHTRDSMTIVRCSLPLDSDSSREMYATLQSRLRRGDV